MNNCEGTPLVVQRLGLPAHSAGGLGSIPSEGTRSHMLQLRVCPPQLKILYAATENKKSCSLNEGVSRRIGSEPSRDPKKVGVRLLIRKVSGSIKDDRDPHEGRSWGRGSRRPVRCPGTQKVPAPRSLPGREDKPQCTPLAGPWLPNGGTTWEGFGPCASWASSSSQILCASCCLSA